MLSLRALLASAIFVLVACGDDGGSSNPTADAGFDAPTPSPDAKVWMDAPPLQGDFSCMGNSEPTTATAEVTLSGTVTNVTSAGAIPQFDTLDGAELEACDAAAANCAGPSSLGTDTSAGGGTFSIGPITTGGAPLDVYLAVTAPVSRDVFVYPAQPLVADQAAIPVLTFDPAVIPLLGLLPGGCTQDDDGNGMLGVLVTDCANDPITDPVTVTVSQNGSPVTTISVVDVSALSAMAAGTYLVCNVPENAETTVGATYNGVDLRAHDVRVVAGTTTMTQVRPGF